MRRARIVLCLPDRAVRDQVKHRLAEAAPSHVLTEATTGSDALDAAMRELPDLLVLAADLPGLDGLAVCHRVRTVAAMANVPVLILGPKGDQRRKYQAFYVGATEYIEVPFDGLELTFRIRNQLRGVLRAADALAAGRLVLEPDTRAVVLPDRRVILTPSEFAVLRLLVVSAGKPVSVERVLTEALRHAPGLGNPQLVHTHVRNLRKKLEVDPALPALLVRHPAGYMVPD